MRLLILTVALLMAGCGGSTPTPIIVYVTPEPTVGQTADPTTVPVATTAAAPEGYVSRATYGDDWPFAVPSGTLACYPSGKNDGRLLVTFNTGDGIEYALNGQARSFGFPELDETVLPSWPDASMLGDLIEQGLALCE